MRPAGGVGLERSLEEEEAEEVEGLEEAEAEEEAGLADSAAADREETAADDEGVAVDGDAAEEAEAEVVEAEVEVEVEVDGGVGLPRCSGGEEVLGERSMEASRAKGPPDVGRKPSIMRSGPTCAGSIGGEANACKVAAVEVQVEGSV